MVCTYKLRIGNETFVLFTAEEDINTLDKLKKELLKNINSNNVQEYQKILESLVDLENIQELNLDDININSVGTYTPAELVKSISTSKEETKLYYNLKIKNWDWTTIIPGYGDSNIKTQYKDGKIFLNLNYINSKFNNIIALTEMALFDNFGEEWFKENDFYEIVNNSNNDFTKLNEILSQIIRSGDNYEKLSNMILTAYYNSNITTEIGSRNINYERINLENAWNKHYKSAIDRRTTHTPYQKINVTDLKQGDYVLIPNPAKLTNPNVSDWGEIFYDYYIDENNEYIIRTVGKNEKDGTYFLRNRKASKYTYDSKNKRKDIKNGNSVDASIEVTEIFDNYEYNDNNSKIVIPIKYKDKALDYNSQMHLLKNPSAKIKLTSKAKASHKILKLEGRTITIKGPDGKQRQKIVGEPNSFYSIEIEAPIIDTNTENYQYNYNTPSIGEGIIVKVDGEFRYGKVLGKDFQRTNSFLYTYKDGSDFKISSVFVRDIKAVEKPSSTNKNIKSLDESNRINTLKSVKFDNNKEATSVENVISLSKGKSGLNLNGLTYSISDIDKYASIKKGDLLYQNGTTYKVLDNVVVTGKDGDKTFYVKTIYSDDMGTLMYLNINRELLSSYILLTDNLNETFARQSVQKNRYELFPDNSKEKTYIEMKVYKNPNGFIYSLPNGVDVSKSSLHEKGAKDFTKEYKEILKDRYKWNKTPEKLYAIQYGNLYKKDSMNTAYIQFDNSSLQELIDAGNLRLIVPGSFISIKGDADAYIVEKTLKDKLLVSKYVYTKFENKNLPEDLKNVKSESFFMHPNSKISLVGIHLPKWAKYSFDELSKYRVDKIKKSIDFEEFNNYSDSKEIIAELSNFLEKQYNIKINLITNKDLRSFNRLDISNARAFTDGNEIYVNIDKASIAEPLHELLHLVMATMKSNNPDTYYTLIKSIENHDDFSIVSKNYNEINTELLEETFIQLFSKTFRKNILKSGIFNEDIFHKAIRQSVSEMLDLTKSLEWEDAYTLMGKSVSDILEEFGSNLINNPESLIDNSSTYMMFEIAGIIKKLVESGDLEQICY